MYFKYTIYKYLRRSLEGSSMIGYQVTSFSMIASTLLQYDQSWPPCISQVSYDDEAECILGRCMCEALFTRGWGDWVIAYLGVGVLADVGEGAPGEGRCQELGTELENIEKEINQLCLICYSCILTDELLAVQFNIYPWTQMNCSIEILTELYKRLYDFPKTKKNRIFKHPDQKKYCYTRIQS